LIPPLDVALARRVLRDFSNATTEKILIDLQVYLSGAREAYMAMLNTVKPNSNVVIDGSLEKEVIVQKIKALIKKL
jgi:uridine kinase